MDKHIPLEQRQRSVQLASAIAAETEQARRAQVASVDLDADSGRTKVALRPFDPRPTPAANNPGADYTPGRAPPVATIMTQTDATAPKTEPAPAPKPFPMVKPRFDPEPAKALPKPAATGGPWRVQLGAFGVRANADKLWDRIKGRPELAGHGKLAIPAGKVTKLQAGGFASQENAQAACNRLKAGGFDCIAVQN